MQRRVTIDINGKQYSSEVEPRTLLVDFIRDHARLTGTHVACTYEGRCGACTVILDGRAVKSCSVLAVQADGSQVLTVEGLSALTDGDLHPIQEGFWAKHGLQCGYCTPGMLMTVYDILKTHPDLDEQTVRRLLIGNICRCTGYSHIVESVLHAAELLARLPAERRQALFPV